MLGCTLLQYYPKMHTSTKFTLTLFLSLHPHAALNLLLQYVSFSVIALCFYFKLCSDIMTVNTAKIVSSPCILARHWLTSVMWLLQSVTEAAKEAHSHCKITLGAIVQYVCLSECVCVREIKMWACVRLVHRCDLRLCTYSLICVYVHICFLCKIFDVCVWADLSVSLYRSINNTCTVLCVRGCV